MKVHRSIGIILLSVWLILTALTSLVQFNFMGLSLIMSLLALAAGILLLIGR